MQCVHTKSELRQALALQDQKVRVLVPTMGALHAGHASLMRQARAIAGKDGLVVATIFLNPVQFDNAGDLQAYPSAPESDLSLCEQCGVDLVFMPQADEMYASDRSMMLEEQYLSTVLCGAKRPGHFAGVCLVVHKLFNLVQPTDAVFGKKDYQQLAILRRMVRDMDIPVTIHGAEIVREADGLALSSRNVRLSAAHRAAAPMIQQSLQLAKSQFEQGMDAEAICAEVQFGLELIVGVQVDYVSIVDATDLHELKSDSGLALLAVAAYFGEVRLIDNIEMQRA
ncbi:MAG: pantoate--beta-alanine ligase [Akkermansia sp.]